MPPAALQREPAWEPGPGCPLRGQARPAEKGRPGAPRFVIPNQHDVTDSQFRWLVPGLQFPSASGNRSAANSLARLKIVGWFPPADTLSSAVMSRAGEVSVNIHGRKRECAVFAKAGPLKSPCASRICTDTSVLLDSCFIFLLS